LTEEGTLRQLKAHRKELVDPKIIGAHQPAIAGNVACENRGQPAVNSVFGHMMAPASLQLLGKMAWRGNYVTRLCYSRVASSSRAADRAAFQGRERQ
jgi:hypothetical protein